MNTTGNLARDLAYIRKGVERADQPVGHAPIYFLWAGIVAVGYAVIDVAEPWAGLYWSVAGPAGGLVSAYLGIRASRQAGQMTRTGGMQQMAHWGGMMACIFLAQLMIHAELMHPRSGAASVILIVGLSYFYAGIYGQRALLWIAALQVACYLTVVYSAAPPWTLIGLSIAAGLTAIGVREKRAHLTHLGPVLVQ